MVAGEGGGGIQGVVGGRQKEAREAKGMETQKRINGEAAEKEEKRWRNKAKRRRSEGRVEPAKQKKEGG